MVNPQIRSKIPNKHVASTISARDPDQSRNGESNTDIAQNNQFRVLSLIERASGVEVVNTSRISVLLSLSTSLLLVLVVVVSGHIGNEV